MIGAILGWCFLLLAAGAFALAVGRRAAAHGILVPVLVGVGLRLVVMVVAHVGSVSLGDRGIFFLDDETYRHGAGVVAELWRGGHFTDPSRYDVLGTYQYGYQLFLAAIFTLGTTSVLLGKLTNVLLGGATVYLVGRLGGELLGERAKVRAAWVAALAPSMVWWSATMMKETLATFLLVLGLLALTRLPRRRALVMLLAVLAALTLVRGPAAVALIAGAGVGVAIAGWRAEGRLLSRPLIAYGLALLAGLAAVVLVVSHGDILSFFHQYDKVVRRMFNLYGGGDAAKAPYNAVKSLVTPVPWAFDSGTRNWDRMLYPGVWLLICALPLAALGAWRLRRRPELWASMTVIAVALVLNSVTGGFTFRQRSMIEPVVLLLALAGATSWRMAARTASAALGVATVAAAIQSRSPIVTAAVAAAGGALFLLSRRLPGDRFELPSESAMLASFRASAEAAAMPGASLGSRVRQEAEGLVRAFAGWIAAVRAAIVRAAPRLGRAEAPEGSMQPAGPVAAARATLMRAAPAGGVAQPIRWFRPASASADHADSTATFLRSGAAVTEPSVPQAPAEGVASPAGGYRPALDGVRAVAVLAVIAYHLGTRMSGGFLGVDVFFVLSGYLITTLLLRERGRRGRISLSNFWARRARRLLPAVLILVAVVALMTKHLGAVGAFAARRDDMVSTVFYYANWHFIAVGQSYFAQFNGTSPLEHMWSLAIEEQFYLLWPLILIGVLLVWRRGARVLLALIVVGAAASAAWMVASYDVADPTRSYFGTDTRAHALLVGAALATILFLRPRLLSTGRLHVAAAWAAVPIAGLVVLAFFAMQDQTGFYYQGGSLAFALVVAAGLFAIEAQPGSIVGRLLSLRAVRWIGMISYGLYLWHWPMIVWIRDSSHITNPRMQQVAAVLLTFAAATLSFYLVERPIRSGRAPWVGMSVRRLAAAMAVAATVVVAIAIQSTSLGSNPIAQQVNDFGSQDCPAGSPSPAPRFLWCSRVAPATARAPLVAVAGDSTALALDSGMRNLASRRGWGYIQAGKNGCSPLALSFPNNPHRAADIAEAKRCITGGAALLADVEAKRHPDVWLVSDRWSLLPLRDRSGRLLAPGDPRRGRLVLAAWRARLAQLTAGGAKVVVVLTPPPGPPVECATKSPPPAQCASGAYTTGDPETVAAQKIVRRAAARFRRSVVVVSVDDIVCPDNGRCPAAIGGVLVRYDGIHYTATFSRRVLEVVFARAKRAGIPLSTR